MRKSNNVSSTKSGNATEFVRYKEIKLLMEDLKQVNAIPTEKIAHAGLDTFDQKRSREYPQIAKSLLKNWLLLFKFYCFSFSASSSNQFVLTDNFNKICNLLPMSILILIKNCSMNIII